MWQHEVARHGVCGAEKSCMCGVCDRWGHLPAHRCLGTIGDLLWHNKPRKFTSLKPKLVLAYNSGQWFCLGSLGGWLLCCFLMGPLMWLSLGGISAGTGWTKVASFTCLATVGLYLKAPGRISKKALEAASMPIETLLCFPELSSLHSVSQPSKSQPAQIQCRKPFWWDKKAV